VKVVKEKHREEAIVAFAGGLLLMTRKKQPTLDECRQIATEIVEMHLRDGHGAFALYV